MDHGDGFQFSDVHLDIVISFFILPSYYQFGNFVITVLCLEVDKSIFLDERGKENYETLNKSVFVVQMNTP